MLKTTLDLYTLLKKVQLLSVGIMKVNWSEIKQLAVIRGYSEKKKNSFLSWARKLPAKWKTITCAGMSL